VLDRRILAALAALLTTACGGSSAPAAPVISSFSAGPASVVLGSSSTLSWTVANSTSLTLDQGIGAVTGESTAVTPGASTTYALTATGPGGSASRTVTVTVTAPPTVLEVACSGASCGAASPYLHSGAGVGIWRYQNTTGETQTVDLHVGGVSAGMQAMLLFSNGTADGMTVLPSAGTLLSPRATALRMEEPVDSEPAGPADGAWHQSLLEANRELGLSLRSVRSPASLSRRAPVALQAPVPPVVGDHRIWNELASTPIVAYDTIAQEICALPGGRRAVIWVDPRSTTSGSITADDLAYFRTTFCGAAGAEELGGYGRVKSLLGDVWGPFDPSLASAVISDGPTPQDVNVVFLEVQGPLASKVWAGYFWGANNCLRSYDPSVASSNEALVFFIDAAQLHVSASSRGYLGSSLLHELTHMVNFYQRAILRDTSHDTWLEETTAMMTEDFATPVSTPDHYTKLPDQRVRPYLVSGGAVGLLGWENPEGYWAGGSLAAFLDRRYGTSILSGTIGCAGGGIDCLDGLIVAGGGTDFADEHARMGASVFGLLPVDGTPGGYGYPRKVSGDYVLDAIDVTVYAASRKPVATPLVDSFLAGSHTYQLDSIAAGHAVYSRTGVVVPAGSSIHLVIQRALP
jgi:hypothetical protein